MKRSKYANKRVLTPTPSPAKDEVSISRMDHLFAADEDTGNRIKKQSNCTFHETVRSVGQGNCRSSYFSVISRTHTGQMEKHARPGSESMEHRAHPPAAKARAPLTDSTRVDGTRYFTETERWRGWKTVTGRGWIFPRVRILEHRDRGFIFANIRDKRARKAITEMLAEHRTWRSTAHARALDFAPRLLWDVASTIPDCTRVIRFFSRIDRTIKTIRCSSNDRIFVSVQ